MATASKPIIGSSRSVIPACDMSDIRRFEVLVAETTKLEGIGGYKIGFELGLGFGLPRVVETARRRTDKPLIYDHQKAGGDIPETGIKFMKVVKRAGINTVIIFPHSGPVTERAWIAAAKSVVEVANSAMDKELGVIVGGFMTHQAYLVSEGGFISDDGALEMYHIAAKAGIRDFVVPGTKTDAIKRAKEIMHGEGIDPVFYVPGFGAQLANFSDVKEVLENDWHAIVSRAIVSPKNGEYGRAAEEYISQLLRV
jgi:orotidine-5'-phosphate decarboxylase